MNKEKLMENWGELKDETKKQILQLADKEIGNGYFVPKIDEDYYCYNYICSKGEIAAVRRSRANGNYDMFNEETGNCFKTDEEATFAGNCDYYTKRFETYVNRHNEQLEWKNCQQPKCFAFYNFQLKKICFSKDFFIRTQGVTYASSQEILEDAIASIGEENFLKYVLKMGG
ncbi:MAG: hypothetical protein RR458_03155 [Clostridia bacterium]